MTKNSKLLYLSVLTVVFTAIICFYLYQGIINSADEIIAKSKSTTQETMEQLTKGAEESIMPVWTRYLKGKNKITKVAERRADSLLSEYVHKALKDYAGVEGGFYFYKLDAFIGYSFPTIPEPKPAFGPPPRSYNIIRSQVRRTIQMDSVITNLHEFDPAIFPLTTRPVYLDGEIIGAAWTRIHIEDELATSQHIQSGPFFLTVGAILLGIIVTVFIVWTLKRQMTEIKDGLNEMKHNPSYRLKEQRGVLGFISRAINDMIQTQQKEQEKREKLERQLFQKEKMATLGNLIAGTAHEINTPISIIKTRIQLWERKLLRSTSKEEFASSITNESLQIIHNEIDRVSRLTKRLLLFSKPVVKEKELIDIHSVIKEKVEWLSEAFPGHSISCETVWDSNIPPIMADKESIEHVLINVLKNAVEASPEECTIIIKTRYLEKQSFAEIRVRDMGIGMAKNIVNKIFDPFFTTKSNGSGLGLSISYEIIKAHHGSIHFEDPKNNGIASKTRYPNSADISFAEAESLAGTICIIKLPIVN